MTELVADEQNKSNLSGISGEGIGLTSEEHNDIVHALTEEEALEKERRAYEEQKYETTCLCCPRVLACQLCGFIDFYINPTVMIFAILIIWGFVIFIAIDVDVAFKVIKKTETFVVKYFTWLYVLALTLFMFFCFYFIFSKYGNIKLGPKDEPPRYSLSAWFSMLFSAGVGVGLYFFGVAEPVFYIGEMQSSSSRWFFNQFNEQGMVAINLAWFHWGLSASACYVIAGLPLAFHHHTQGEPMRESVCFIELIGKKYVNAAIGNIIDVCSVVGTMFGVSTSLGLGALQLNAGLKFVFGIKESLTVQALIIWGITLFATISVLSGVDKGIKLLSQIFIFLSCITMFYIFWSGETVFFINTLIQGIGYHITWLLELQFSTQAFEQAGFYDASVDKDGADYQAGWMKGWTVFYWAWWIAWAPFVGIFLANISRGRTVRQFVIGNMLVPTAITCVWFSVVGGWGLYNEMGSIQEGLTCDNDTTMFNNHKIIKLSCYSTPEIFFAALKTLPFPEFTSIIVMSSIVLGFVTSSDSASMVIDILTASGNEFPPKIQRLFWALTEGAVATALLGVGYRQSQDNPNNALIALQVASLVGALPLAIILLFELMATIKSFKIYFGELKPNELIYWKHDLFSIQETFCTMIIGFIIPPYFQTRSTLAYYSNIKYSDDCSLRVYNLSYWLLWITIILLLIISIIIKDEWYARALFDYAMTVYILWIALSISNRRRIKNLSKIDSSNFLFDLLSWIFCWGCASAQEALEMEEYQSIANDFTNLKPVELVATYNN